MALILALTRSLVGTVIAGTVFAVHPLHTEAVANIVGRAELMSALFGLSMLYAYHLAAQKSGRPRWLLSGLVLVAYFLAMISKENAITLLAVPVLYELLVYPGFRKSREPLVPLRGVVTIVGLIAVTAAYLVIRMRILGTFTVPNIQYIDNPMIGLSVPLRLASAMCVFGQYMLLSLVPLNLSCD